MSTSGSRVDLGGGLHAYQAVPEGEGPFPAVLIFIEAFGLNGHFQRLTERFAAAGFFAITPDLYDGKVYDYADLPGAIAHLQQLDDDAVMAHAAATLDHLAQQPGVDASRVAVTGFCMGGRFAFLASCELGARLRAAAAFYGGGIGPPVDPFGRPPLLDRAAEIEAPLLLWYGGKDTLIRPDEHARIAEALGQAGKQYTLTVFPAATHGFFCEERGSYHPESADRTWRATLAFFREYLS